MIVEKRSPALAWWPSRFRHVLCHCGLADIDPELEQFTMDTGSAPERVCNAYLANKLTNLSWGSRPTAPGSRFAAPISLKAGTMPTDQLVPKYKVLSLQRCPRSEQPDESGADQFAETIHQP